VSSRNSPLRKGLQPGNVEGCAARSAFSSFEQLLDGTTALEMRDSIPDGLDPDIFGGSHTAALVGELAAGGG
jgi:hypothetical protein